MLSIKMQSIDCGKGRKLHQLGLKYYFCENEDTGGTCDCHGHLIMEDPIELPEGE